MAKICCYCGTKFSFLGGKAIYRGNICNACYESLSPLLYNYKSFNPERIKHHLDRKKDDRERMREFVGDSMFQLVDCALYFDFKHGRIMVRTENKKKNYVPDIFTIDEIEKINIERIENCEEIKYINRNGERRSFAPKRYAYSYDFIVHIHLNIPEYAIISYAMNPDRIDNNQELLYNFSGTGLIGEIIQRTTNDIPVSNKEEVFFSGKYQKYDHIARAIEFNYQRLLQKENTPSEPKINEVREIKKVTPGYIICPWCDSRILEENTICPHCGGHT